MNWHHLLMPSCDSCYVIFTARSSGNVYSEKNINCYGSPMHDIVYVSQPYVNGFKSIVTLFSLCLFKACQKIILPALSFHSGL